MEYVVEVAIGVFVLVFAYILRELSTMSKKQAELNSRVGIEEAKGEARDGDSKEIKSLLRVIASDLSTIKEEQGYWRGRQESQS